MLTDERIGTISANQLGIITIGLLGVLWIPKQNEFISSVKKLLDELLDNNFGISEIFYNQILKEANEL